MKEKIGLFYKTPGKVVGCQKVYDNLIKGLNKLNVEIHDNKVLPMCGCLHGAVPKLQDMTLPNNCLIGPEIMVLPTNQKKLWTKYKHWTQPSQWVIDYMSKFNETKDVTQYVWPVGIDTDEFNPDKRGNFKRDCFIYYKTVTGQVNENNLNILKKKLDNMNLTYKILKYGNYTENEYRELINTSKFGILLTGTESQGIGYMEALSMNCPLYVIDMKEFAYKRSNFKFTNQNVSSAPYFDDRCGMKGTINGLLMFLNDLKYYSPRDYIMDNHTVKKGAEKYMNILRNIHG